MSVRLAAEQQNIIIFMLLKMIRDTPLRGKKHIEIWADNCSSQNKNYYIMGALWSLVDQQNNAHETITLKSFEPGHTFMAADAVHAAVERNMVATKNVIGTDHFSNNKNGSRFLPDFMACFQEKADFQVQPDLHRGLSGFPKSRVLPDLKNMGARNHKTFLPPMSTYSKVGQSFNTIFDVQKQL